MSSVRKISDNSLKWLFSQNLTMTLSLDMNAFLGHVFTGSLFIIASFWWTADALNHYFRNVTKQKFTKSTSDVKLDFSECHNKLGQGLFMVSATVVEIATEYWTDGPVISKHNIQHMSIHMFFFFFGLSYLLSHWSAPIPADAPYFTLLLSFFGETLLFYFHLHGRSHLDIHVHTLLVIAAAFTALCTCFEWKYKQSVMAALGRPFCCFVQGTWFWQIAFILHNPLPFSVNKWEENNHDHIMLITAMFCWHIVAALIWFTFLCFAYNRKYQMIWSVTYTRQQSTDKYQQLIIDDE